MVKVNINISPNIDGIKKQAIRKICYKVFKLVGICKGELSLFFTNNKKIAGLNKKYRDIDSPTDVLAFSMREGAKQDINPQVLGDVVISVDMVRDNSVRFGTKFDKELYLYIIHGILHLLGFSDEDKKTRLKMEKKQQELFRKIT